MAVVDVDAIAVYLGGLADRANWLGPKVSSHMKLVYVHEVKQVNCHNGCHDDSTVNIITALTDFMTHLYIDVRDVRAALNELFV